MTRLPVLWGYSTQWASIDFETYSEAGYVRDPLTGKISGVANNKSGIAAVGAAVYAEHPTCEILSMAYDLRDGLGERLWTPLMPPPFDLFHFILSGDILSAWHSYFEYKIWKEVCAGRMGWPVLPLSQLRDAMAKARAFALPGKLANAGAVLQTEAQKMEEGPALIKRFCCPRSWTKKNKVGRVRPENDPKGPLFYEYNVRDIKAEAAISAMLPDLSPFEEEVFQLDQIINERGIQVDISHVNILWGLVEQAIIKYNTELSNVTGGALTSASEREKMLVWLHGQGVHLDDLQEDTIDKELPNVPEGVPHRVLEIRQLICSAAVAKLAAMQRQTSADGRMREQFTYCGADRTGRFSAMGAQLHNFPTGGTELIKCENGCGRYYGAVDKCPFCGIASFLNPAPVRWTPSVINEVLSIASMRSLNEFEHHYGNAITAISGCLRGMLVAAPGKRFICSDFSAIEAVVLAELAGETWRQEVFRTHGKIYEMSASKISGVPFEEFMEYKRVNEEHHPLRKKLGKVAELASGYKGWVGAWKKFGADEYFTDEQTLKQAILKWRADNPNITRFWDNIELAFYMAVNSPSERFDVSGIKFGMIDDKLVIQLLSGRKLVYHQPMATREMSSWNRYDYQFSYMRWNSNRKKGLVNVWLRVNTWVGETVENIDQAISRDILCHSMLNLERAGYSIVMHVHDEIVAEVPEGFGSVEEFERIGSTLPEWCKNWPVKMAGGWIGQRYKKE